jgi:hypothetical protein
LYKKLSLLSIIAANGRNNEILILLQKSIEKEKRKKSYRRFFHENINCNNYGRYHAKM